MEEVKRISPRRLIGKTVEAVQFFGFESFTFLFTDGTEVRLEAQKADGCFNTILELAIYELPPQEKEKV